MGLENAAWTEFIDPFTSRSAGLIFIITLNVAGHSGILGGHSTEHSKRGCRRMNANPLQIACLLTTGVCFASFTWAIQYLFRRPATVSKQMKLLSLMGLVFFIAQVLAIAIQAKVWILTSLVAIAIYLGALALFYWAVPYARSGGFCLAFSSVITKELVRAGPYRYIRHPFYASYLLFWVAGVMASHQPLLLLSVVFMAAFYARAIAHEEKQFLSGPLSADYTQYMAMTGRLLPRLPHRHKTHSSER
jgi:protein-S-isoprenylcysteine O-methyltransferase Ste14